MNAFKKVAREVSRNINSHLAASDKDSEWQRVNSYIADVLKDAHVLYAKLARLQGDFAGTNLEELEKISENVLDIGGKLSAFSKAFYEGRVEIAREGIYGESQQPSRRQVPESADHSQPQEEAPSSVPSSPEQEDVDIEFDYEAPKPDSKNSKKN